MKSKGRVLAALLIPGMFLLPSCSSAQEEEETTNVDMQTYEDWVSDASDDLEVFPDFTTIDLSGNTVTQEIFAQADITVVNIWATFCSPCIEEMPDLAAWYDEMPDNVQIIGIVADISDETDFDTILDAEDIAEAAGVNFINLVPSNEILAVTHSIPGYPTTYFVDNDGDIVDVPVYGANVSTYQYIVEQYLAGAYDEHGDLIDD